MLLSDVDIRREVDAGRIVVDPFDPGRVQPSSLDVTLAATLRVPVAYRCVDLGGPIPDDLTVEAPADTYVLRPGEFVLGSTAETLTLPGDVASRLEGRSTLGRLGLAVHATAGYIDPGFSGQVTLEMSNVGPWPLVLRAGQDIGQLVFERMSSPVERPYGSPGLGSKYQGQRGPTPARTCVGCLRRR